MKQVIFLGWMFFAFIVHTSAQQVEVTYKTYCGGCHGGRMEGNSGPALIKSKWQHGSTLSAISRTIRSGIPKTEMKGWSDVLKSNDIIALTNYIIASQKGPAKKAPYLPAKIITADYTLKVEKLDSGHTATPWGIEFVDATRALISEKPGRLKWLING